jgi:hypothetical protein
LNVQRLTIADHAVLATVAAFVATLPVPRPPYHERGDWRRDVEAGPPAGVDRPKPFNFRRHSIPVSKGPTLPPGFTVSAINYYPVGGAGLGWHTDSVYPGWRIYVAQPLLLEAPGAFLFGPGAVLEDAPGQAIAFKITGDPGDSWHAVRAEGARFSVGIRIRDRAVAATLGLT